MPADNMRWWEALKQPPADALREIKAGRLKGKSDIDPLWRIEAMTALFGPCGVGWRYTIDRCWREDSGGGVVQCYVQVSIFVRTMIPNAHVDQPDRYWSDAIPGIGGNHLVQKESAGLHSNDEGYKMALTDALGNAMRNLGVAADVYRGRWDGSKYADERQAVPVATRPSGPAKAPAAAPARKAPAASPAEDTGDPNVKVVSIPSAHEGKRPTSIEKHVDYERATCLNDKSLVALVVGARMGAEAAGLPREAAKDALAHAASSAGAVHYSCIPWKGNGFDKAKANVEAYLQKLADYAAEPEQGGLEDDDIPV